MWLELRKTSCLLLSFFVCVIPHFEVSYDLFVMIFVGGVWRIEKQKYKRLKQQTFFHWSYEHLRCWVVYHSYALKIVQKTLRNIKRSILYGFLAVSNDLCDWYTDVRISIEIFFGIGMCFNLFSIIFLSFYGIQNKSNT